MDPPNELVRWLKNAYPKPQIDPDWLRDCYNWVLESYHLNPRTDMNAIIGHVEEELLESQLQDSMVAGTGVPTNINNMRAGRLSGPPVLVQIVSIMDIGHSAFSLQNVRQTRIERADLAGLMNDNNEEDAEDDGPVPKYPRSMLQLKLSDGHTTFQAIEYRRLPELELGETPLGYKVLLQDVSIRGGYAFLEPKCVKMKGHQTRDLDEQRDADFVRALRARLGQPAEDVGRAPQPPGHAGGTRSDAPPALAPIAVARTPPPTQIPPVRSPLMELASPSPLPEAGPSGFSHDDDEGQPRRRKLPNARRSPSPHPPPRIKSGTPSLPERSRYFLHGDQQNQSADLAQERLFSPHHEAAIIVDSDDEDDGNEPQPRPVLFTGKGKGKGPAGGGSATGKVLAPDSDDDMYDDDEDLNDAEVLEKIALLEQGLYGTASRAVSRPPETRPTPSGSGLGRGTNEREVISIDEDEDDKENVPAPTRHVRRRVAVPVGQVIEISD